MAKSNGSVIRGDVVLCDLNPVIGTEQSGIRPVIVIQIDRANGVSPHTIIVPLTTKIRRKLLDSHVFIPEGIAGLSQDSVALCEQIRVIDKSRIIRVMGHLDNPYLEELETALRTILGLL
ncbi:MAG: type II toxin-antitoxin system PemK/MazF family toxin [Microcystis sp.]|uniref:type II toxin-antitoxin system PemK/MazF family toxin n=1 Tax=unclassified Microcystis TaxID=2643300 RepID=UPI00258F77E5|nr:MULTISPECIES: type II toxin-antitoxin system PemK/MazF family toxin [unclassified Microcystis]MCU7243359.1 type II toxin-antitoxin system PemK/MazF family toxin [Microcystis aeruginosa WS75]